MLSLVLRYLLGESLDILDGLFGSQIAGSLKSGLKGIFIRCCWYYDNLTYFEVIGR